MKKILLLSIYILTALTVPAQTGDSTLNGLLRAIWNFRERKEKRDSLLNHPLGSNTEDDYLRWYTFYDSVNNQLNQVDQSALAFNDQVNLELLKYSIEDEIYPYKYKAHLNPILAESGFHTELVSMASQIMTSKKDFDDYINRLRDIPRFVNENLELMRRGLKLGISQPMAVLTNYNYTYDQHIVTDHEQSGFWKPFQKKPSQISEEDWKKITGDGKQAILQQVIPAFKSIKVFFESEYYPTTRRTIGVSNFPNGLEYYKELVRHYTTTNLGYDEIFEIGQKEVQRINQEMWDVIREVNFKGDLQEFIAFLRTDPKFYATTAKELLKEASFIAKKIDGKLPQFFGRLPRQPYGVEPVPAHLAPTYTGGRYSPSPIKGRRAAFYWVNTYDLKSRPLYTLESLTLHEAVPGHHLQIALTQELDSLPAFRKNLYVNAFGEGWGLYSEWLGKEMGLYTDPYSRFGRLTYEMWRACRLVIDVGLHAKGWTREQAVQYLSENTALSLHEVNTEINRYISWPGQALAYKIGELKIKELRKRAEDALKEKFDLREFHDLVLSQGTVTLSILEKMVDRWIENKK